MTRSRRAALALLACTLPLSAFAAERCAHEAPRTLPIDLDGVKTVVFDIGAQTLSVAPAGTGPASVSARACASSPSLLPQLQFTQARQGDKLVVTASRERSMPLWDNNDRYARLIVDARLPADLMVQVRVGAGEAVVDGFRAAIMDLRKTLNIPENLTALGVTNPNLDELTDMALEDPSCGGNPVAMTRENTLALFKACL